MLCKRSRTYTLRDKAAMSSKHLRTRLDVKVFGLVMTRNDKILSEAPKATAKVAQHAIPESKFPQVKLRFRML
ncbi:hypothetical protein RRG08_059446 [Elysia crispata]|uniref:Uncharacterized protein n=1 Tax=Elysia crispata TaxID=231223 RepID=A0AAE1A4H5_9GAST|nr:hypothetical protein RRG08_059446 [Elysia crispata]